MAQSFPHSHYAVLVVEDDPLLLFDAMDLVEEAGFVAYSARNAEQAIQLMERHSEIRVLFTDVEMPGSMDGLMLARAVRDRWPPVTIIVTSGRVAVSKDELPEDGIFFPKPFSPTSIVQTLRGLGAHINS